VVAEVGEAFFEGAPFAGRRTLQALSGPRRSAIRLWLVGVLVAPRWTSRWSPALEQATDGAFVHPNAKRDVVGARRTVGVEPTSDVERSWL